MVATPTPARLSHYSINELNTVAPADQPYAGFQGDAIEGFEQTNLRAVQLLLGHTKMESTIKYLGIEVDDALEIAEQMEI